jgi:hypothetical protein
MNESAKITIANLNIKLPPGFGRRADAIARGAARHLARLPIRTNVQLASLAVPKVSVQGGETDTVIARRIARAIHSQIKTSGRKGIRHAD